MASNFANGHQQTRGVLSKGMRTLRSTLNKKLKTSENRNAAVFDSFSSRRMTARRTNDQGEEHDIDSGDSTEASGETDKRQSSEYLIKPEPRFGREEVQVRDNHIHPYDKSSQLLPNTLLMTPNENLGTRSRRRPATLTNARAT